MKRFSILGMMGLISALAVALAALRYAGEAWAGLLLATLLGLLGVAILGVVYRRGNARAGWLGFLVFGGGYALIAFCPGLSSAVGDRLPTTQALGYAHTRVVGPRALISYLGPPAQDQGIAYGIQAYDPAGEPAAIPVPATLRLDGGVAWQSNPAEYLPVSSVWQSMLPGAADHDPFLRTGHSLFGLLAGLAGAMLARRFEKTKAD